MKRTIQRQLNAYAAAAGSIAIAGAAHGQSTTYVDINPDTTVHDSVYYELDMDSDGQPEIRFETHRYQGSAPFYVAQARLQGNANNALLGSMFAGVYPFPYALNNNDSISSTNTHWKNATLHAGVQYLAVVYGITPYANWGGVNDKYLGLRFMIGPDTHYGWVRLSVTPGADSITIKDYAYELLPNIGITAGSLVGIPAAAAGEPVHIFSSGNTVVLQNTQVQKGGSVRVMNTMGQSVYENAITEEYMRIDLGETATGIYFVELLRDNEKIVKKVYVH